MSLRVMKLIDMSKAKQFGILLIIIGIFIPSILFPFTSLTDSATATKVFFAMKGVSYDTNLRDLEVVLMKGERTDNKKVISHYKGRFVIPYRYSIAFGILLAFIGIGIVALYRNKKRAD